MLGALFEVLVEGPFGEEINGRLTQDTLSLRFMQKNVALNEHETGLRRKASGGSFRERSHSAR